MSLKHLSLFSGIGGFDLASQWMGWENVAHCEINEFCLKILKYYWPNAATHTDIKSTDFTIYRGLIDIVTGGFPCQPYSVAGLQKGKEDERHLWPEMLRAIREIQPSWVVGENVLGLVNWNGGLVFNEVQVDLEAEGYEVWPYVLPACAVNAPHRRDRVWFVANTNCTRRQKLNIADFATQSRFLARYLIERWAYFPAQSPICNGNDGLSPWLDGITFSKWRNESIKAAGNAIVPQVVYQIFKAIEQYNLSYC